MSEKGSLLQAALEAIEGRTLEEQEMVFEIAYNRYIERRRDDLVREVAAARQAYRRGQVRRGSVKDLMVESEERR